MVPSAGAATQAQPFEEQTTTMIVFPQGGVLKMETTVSSGQVMVLNNLKSRQDAICRVLKVRAFAKGQSYVEIEFTSPQPGYWGVYFPSDGPEVARMAQQQSAAAPETAQPAPAASTSAPPAIAKSSPQIAIPAPVEQKVPEAPRAPAAPAVQPPAKAPEPAVRAESPKPVIVSPPPAPPKKPEYSFVALDANDEVLAPADSTRVPRSSSVPASTSTNTSAQKPQSSPADADISDAIDALMASVPRASSTPAPARPAAGDWTLEDPASGSDVPVSSPSKSLHSFTGNTDARPPAPKQMFGVMLDSGSSASMQISRRSGNIWIPIGIAALLAVGAAGAYYFHFRPATNAAAFSSTVAEASAPASESSSQPSVSQPAPSPAQVNDAVPSDSASMPSATGTSSNDAGFDSTASAAKPPRTSAESREFDPYAPRHASVAETEPPAQPNVAIPSTAGVLKARPVIRPRAHAGSIGAAPTLDVNAGPGAPSVSFAAIAPPAPKLEAPPKPVPTAPIRVGGRIQPPRLVSSVLPVYPPIAQQANVTGTVVIDTTIDKDGNVSKTRVISGPQLLRGAALSALRQWKYEPSKLNGQPISVEMVISIQFH